MSAERIIALVGRRDEPTDGVADYCDWLGGSLNSDRYQFEAVRVNWLELGWRAALAELKEKAKHLGADAGSYYCSTRLWHGRAGAFPGGHPRYSRWSGKAE